MRSRRLVVLSVAVLLGSTALAGCSKDDIPLIPDAKEGESTPLVELSPLTGLPMENGQPDNPVFVVKIENTDGGAPQYGLDKADLVVEELVEGGLTRLAALYYSELPAKVGHVRSLRATDIGIAAPVAGQVVASGGASQSFKRLKKAGVKVFDEDHGAPGFSSDPAKYRPYNRLIDLQRLDREADVTDIPNAYFSWTPEGVDDSDSTATPAAPKAARAASVRFSNSTVTRWRHADDGKWERTNGHAQAGHDFRADTLIVIEADLRDAGYTDPAGNPVPETIIEGSGKATILGPGGVLTGTWTKPELDSTMTFAAADGTEITINPGHVWIEIIPKGAGRISVE